MDKINIEAVNIAQPKFGANRRDCPKIVLTSDVVESRNSLEEFGSKKATNPANANAIISGVLLK